MGIFDNSQFSPQSFSGAMPGWLQQALQSGLLGRSLGEQTPMQPQTGPTFAQGDSGSMGGVPFPILGQAPVPQSAMLPPNAQPTQYQPPQQQQMPTALQSPAGGNLGAAFQGFVNAKSPMQAIGNLVSGLATGQRTDPAGMAQQTAQATYSALRQAGVPDGVAQAAALNPEVLKTIAPQIYQKPELKDAGTDPLTGKKTFQIYDPNKQTLTEPASGNKTSSPQGGSLEGFNTAIQSGVTGEALYDYVPAAMRNTVKGMIEGRQQPPTGAAMRSPQTMALIDMAHSIDPTFDATTWGARAASAKDFSAGKSSEMVRAANQTLHHVGALLDSFDKLGNTFNPTYNAVGNYVNKNILGKGAVTEFLPNAHAVAEEMSKVFKGANLSDAEVRQWEASLNENMSPEQQRASVGKLVELLNGSLQALNDKRERGLGPIAAAKQPPVLNEDSQKVMGRISKWVAGQSTPPAAQGAPQTATGPGGQKLVLQNGQWVPMK